MRAAFYYGWYPEQWTKAGHRYTPLMGLYDSSSVPIVRSHVQQMQYARLDAAFWSWWGAKTPTDSRFRQALDAAADLGFKLAVYYELDNAGQATPLRVWSDLVYLKRNYFDHPAYLRVGGKPVVFVYNPESTVIRAQKWVQARDALGLYVSLADYPQWWTSNLVDSWHGYRPAERLVTVQNGGHVHAMSVSAGFWSAAAGAEPRLARDYEEFRTAAFNAHSAQPDWELYYFNEHGEGTAIEPSDALCNQVLCSDYLAAVRGAVS